MILNISVKLIKSNDNNQPFIWRNCLYFILIAGTYELKIYLIAKIRAVD